MHGMSEKLWTAKPCEPIASHWVWRRIGDLAAWEGVDVGCNGILEE